MLAKATFKKKTSGIHDLSYKTPLLTSDIILKINLISMQGFSNMSNITSQSCPKTFTTFEVIFREPLASGEG